MTPPQRTVCAMLIALCQASSVQGFIPTGTVAVNGTQLLVNGAPFFIKGVCYSPTPIGHTVYWFPKGDYFIDEFQYIWRRDLPMLKSMGANTIRVYGWNNTADHTLFLDTVHEYDMKVLITFFMGTANDTNVTTEALRVGVMEDFAGQVRKYNGHPALLMWSFGNELNGVWNLFLDQLSDDFNCGWNSSCWEPWMHHHVFPNCTKPKGPEECVYTALFQMMSNASLAAHRAMGLYQRPVISGFADVDKVFIKFSKFGAVAPHMDLLAAQLYRGSTFGDFYESVGAVGIHNKPVIISEYGVDSFNDPCGYVDETPCYNTKDDLPGFVDEVTQAKWDSSLSKIILDYSSAQGCSAANSTDCVAVGGFLMSWVDEYWKGSIVQSKCMPPKGQKGFSPMSCDKYAHVTCGNWNSSVHDLCGYRLDAMPDGYINEEWFGINSPSPCTDTHHSLNGLNMLSPRKVFHSMRELWADADSPPPNPLNCEQLQQLVLGPQCPGRCSGKGECEVLCLTPGANCEYGSCNCHFGYSSADCSQLDVRAVLGLGMMLTMGALLLVKVTLGITRRLTTSQRAPHMRQELLPVPQREH